MGPLKTKMLSKKGDYMQIPKNIEKLIERRERLAYQLDKVVGELDDWLDKNDIVAEDCDTHGGVEIYVNPTDSAERIRQCILNKNN